MFGGDRDLLLMLAPLLAACLQLVLLERGLSGQQRQLARQQQWHERLLDTAYGAGGREELCATLHAVLQRPLLLLDNLRRPLASHAWPADPIQVAHGLKAHALRDGRAVTLTVPGRAPLTATAIAIALQSNRAGTLLIAHHDKPLDDVETRAAEQAASLLAVEFLQQRSLAATANQVANAVLLSLFSEGLSSADAQRLLLRLGVTSCGPWRVLVLELRGPLASDDAPALTNGPLLREALDRSLGALRGRVRLLHWRDDLVVIADEASAERFNDRALLRRLQQTLDRIDGVAQPLRLRIGIGRAEADPALLAVSLKTADQALRALARLPRKSTTLKFEDLGVYRLLLGGNLAHDHDEFAPQVLAPILRGKGRQALLTTLSALVAHNFNLAAVARQLGVHQNTIKYRMRQLREAFGRDPSRGDLRLEIELALKIRLLQ